MSKRKAADIPADELLAYDIAHQRWSTLAPEKILEEAATIFNMAVFMAGHAIRRERGERSTSGDKP